MKEKIQAALEKFALTFSFQTLDLATKANLEFIKNFVAAALLEEISKEKKASLKEILAEIEKKETQDLIEKMILEKFPGVKNE